MDHGDEERGRTIERIRDWIASGDIAAARAALRRLGPRDDAGVAHELVTAELAARTGELGTARRHYERCLETAAIATAEQRARALAGLSRVFARVARGGREQRLLARARELVGADAAGDPDMLLIEGRLAARRGDLELALTCHGSAYRGAVERDARGLAGEALVEIARVLAERGELATADARLGEAEGLLAGRRGAARRVAAHRAALALARGRPTEAEPVLRAAVAEDERTGDRLGLARDLRLLGLARYGLGLEQPARILLLRARELSVQIEDGRAIAACELGLSHAALDDGDPVAAASHAEAGLRVLAPAAASIACWLRLALVQARLSGRRHDAAGALLSRFRRSCEQHPDAALGVSVQALGAAVAACCGDVEQARSGFAVAMVDARGLSRRVVEARILAAALDCLPGLSERARAEVVARLDEIAGDLPVVARWRRRAPVPAPATPLLDDGLAVLHSTLVAADADDARRRQALGLLDGKVPYRRAAFLVDDGDGLRVVCRRDGDADPLVAAAMRAALIIGEVAQLTRATVTVEQASADPRLREAGELVEPDLGPVCVTHARDGLLLYLDRRHGGPRFSAAEVGFAEALVERVALEPVAAAMPRDRGPERALDDLGIVGECQHILRVRQEIEELAPFDMPVFVAGESGTGKELVSRALHRLSPRREREMVTINCAALAEGLLESELFGATRGAFSGAVRDRGGLLDGAHGSTLFLDEVGELSLGFQAKLLRVVEQGEFRRVGSTELRRVDVRFVCATNRDVAAAVREGRMREDLYYRLMSAASIELPPLRERAGDLAALIRHFAGRESRRHELAPLRLSREALAAIERYVFPGNVRELERMIAALVARCRGRKAELADLPDAVRGVRSASSTQTLADARARFERSYLVELLHRHGHNKTHAARTAGIARQTLLLMLKRHRLDGGRRAPSSEE